MNLLKNKKEINNIMIGRHMSVSNPDFLVGAVKKAISYEANALALFIGSPHSHYRRNILELKPEDLKKFLENDKKISIKNIIVHASYVINLGNTIDLNTFQSSVKLLRTDIKRMSIIGLGTIVIHPGYALSASRSESILQIAKGINQILIDNPPVRIALETMSGKGSEIGINFREINEIIQKIERKEKVGVCWDTCHLYSAGYDIKNNLEEIIEEFEEIIGLDKLWIIHVNDSIFDLGQKKDRHENVGFGKIGFDALKRIVWHPKFNKAVKILETPTKREIYKQEIIMLKQN